MPLSSGRSKPGHDEPHRLSEPDAAAQPSQRPEVPDLAAGDDTGKLHHVPEMLAMGHLVEAGLALTGTPPPLGTAKFPKRRPGRPAGRNYDKVTISLDSELVARIDEFAEHQSTSRSKAARELLRAGIDATATH